MGEIVVGRVAEIWRYPVKSLGGERIDRVGLDARGVEGDRAWALRGRDGKLGSGKNTRRFRRMNGLLGASSRIATDGAVLVSLADGIEMPVGSPDAAIAFSNLVGEEVEFSFEEEVSHLDDSALHLVTTSSLEWLAAILPSASIEPRRFRPNLVLDVQGAGRTEDSWVGRRLGVGRVVLSVHKPTERCVMTTMEQPGLVFAPSILRALEVQTGGNLGVYAKVESPGDLGVGDAVTLLE